MLKSLTAMLLALAAPAQAFEMLMETPAKNIQCVAAFGEDGVTLTCALLEVSADAQTRGIPDNPDCTQSWARMLQIKGRGEVVALCAPTPAALDGAEELRTDGEMILHGIRCSVGEDSLFCKNQDGKMFFLSNGMRVAN